MMALVSNPHTRLLTAPDAGFSMLETIAALAILAMALIPLLSLQSQLASGAARLERQAELNRATEVAYTYLALVNPMLAPEGKQNLGDGWQVSWISSPLGAPQPARFGIGRSSRYLSQPFQIDALLVSASGRETVIHRRAQGVYELTPFTSRSID